MYNQTAYNDKETPIIPGDIIMENILPRLPIKPLLRFKSVSHFWLSTISSPKFAKLQLKFHPPTPQFLLFLYNRNPPRRVVSIPTDEEFGHLKELANVDLTYNHQYLYVVGSCNGLVCLHDQEVTFCLWNPATRCCHYFDGPESGEHDKLLALGFGYVSSVDECRIACLMSSKKDVSVNVYIFSFRAAKWEKMTSVHDDGREIDQEEAAVMIEDTLYCSSQYNFQKNRVVVGVNMVNGEVSKIPFPEMFRTFVPIRVKLFKMKERLSYYCVDLRGDITIIWMLRRNGTGWLKLFEFYSLRDIDLLYGTEDGKFLLSIQKLNKVFLLDPSEIHHKEFEGGVHFDDYFFLAGSSALEYKESMVSPIIVSAENNQVQIENPGVGGE